MTIGVLGEDVANEIERALFQVSALATMAEEYSRDYSDSTFLSFSQIVSEKAEFCLRAIDENRARSKAAEVQA